MQKVKSGGEKKAAELKVGRGRIDIELRDNSDSRKPDGGKIRGEKKIKLSLQPWRDISWPRRILITVFGALFVWCAVPIFFGICSIGVIVSSLIMLCVFLAALLWHIVEENRSLRTDIICVAAGLMFSVGLVAFSVVSGIMLKASMTTVPDDCPNYTLVVLGCKADGDRPSWMLSDRLDKAYRVLEDNSDIMCVVSGGRGKDEQYSEAYVMKKYLTDKGISPSRIIMEEVSGSTEENLLYTKNAVELNGLSKNIVIVTDRFHELRARIWAEKSGFENIYSACCETRPYLVIGYWFREMFGLARLYVFGR